MSLQSKVEFEGLHSAKCLGFEGPKDRIYPVQCVKLVEYDVFTSVDAVMYGCPM